MIGYISTMEQEPTTCEEVESVSHSVLWEYVVHREFDCFKAGTTSTLSNLFEPSGHPSGRRMGVEM